MSFTIFVSTATNNESDMFDRVIVERAFKDIAVKQAGDY